METEDQENHYEVFVGNIVSFVVRQIRTEMPEVFGAAFGIPLGTAQDILELPGKEQGAKVMDALCVEVHTHTELAQEQKDKIYKLIGEKFFRITKATYISHDK